MPVELEKTFPKAAEELEPSGRLGLADACQLRWGMGGAGGTLALEPPFRGSVWCWNTIQELHCHERYLDLFWSSCSAGCATLPLSRGMLVSLLRVGGSWWLQPDPQLCFGVGLSFYLCAPKMNPQVMLAIPERFPHSWKGR